MQQKTDGIKKKLLVRKKSFIFVFVSALLYVGGLRRRIFLTYFLVDYR